MRSATASMARATEFKRLAEFALERGTQIVRLGAGVFDRGAALGLDHVDHDQPKQRDDAGADGQNDADLVTVCGAIRSPETRRRLRLHLPE